MLERVCHIALMALTILGRSSRACEIPREDLSGLLNFQRNMMRGVPSSIPGYSEILKRAPALEGLTVDCVAIGPLRFIHAPESKSVFVLDVKKAFDRWDVRDTGNAPWQKALQGYIRDYLAVHRSTLAQAYGRPEFSAEERALLEHAQKENVPEAVQIGIPHQEELGRSESFGINSATRGLISRLILDAVMTYLGQQRPGAWVERLEIGQLGSNDSFVSVRAVVAMGKGESEPISLKIAVNPRMAPYVGTVYPASP